MKKYRKKPVVVSAEQWWKVGDVPDANIWELDPDGICPNKCRLCGNPISMHGQCKTMGGALPPVCPGDYIIRGVKGEYYPCKPDIFTETYESVETSENQLPKGTEVTSSEVEIQSTTTF
ncbi:hypothetical protein [Paenibacillus larvae]|uniref:hypothetical protein n=1 Tax=Paenibacillus larvae TaxID=1464 RepID=UPI001F3DF476|nr:hypothetical protein [Paenibacillus larvae]